MQLTETFKRVKTASKTLAQLSDDMRNDILNAVADAIIDYQERILSANEKDLAKQVALDAAKKKAAQEAKQYAKQHGITSTPDGFDKLYQEQQPRNRKHGRRFQDFQPLDPYG